MDAKQLLSEALRLPVNDRAAVLDGLMESLEASIDPDVEADLAREPHWPEDGIESGATRISWSEAFRRIHQAAARRDS